MRISGPVVLAASLALCAAPALAASTTSSANTTDSDSAASGNNGQNGDQAEQQLVQSLQKAGFTHIHVEPRVFIVHALNAHGDPVLMRISPDAMEAVTTVPTGKQNKTNAMNGSGSGAHTTQQ